MRAARFAAAICLALLSACAGQETTRPGFLGDYSAMKADKDGALRQRASAAAHIAERYRAFIVDHVVYRPGPKSEKLSEAEIAELGAHYRNAATKLFGEKYQAANGPRPGVMRVRLAALSTHTNATSFKGRLRILHASGARQIAAEAPRRAIVRCGVAARLIGKRRTAAAFSRC